MSRVIDAMVAEKVMGVALSEGAHCGCCYGRGEYPRCGVGREGRRTRPTMQPCPNCRGAKRLGIVRPGAFSTDPRAAWEVVDKMRASNLTWGFSVGTVTTKDGVWWRATWLTITNNIHTFGRIEGEATEATRELAICLAALRACGCPESEIETALKGASDE